MFDVLHSVFGVQAIHVTPKCCQKVDRHMGITLPGSLRLRTAILLQQQKSEPCMAPSLGHWNATGAHSRGQRDSSLTNTITHLCGRTPLARLLNLAFCIRNTSEQYICP